MNTQSMTVALDRPRGRIIQKLRTLGAHSLARRVLTVLVAASPLLAAATAQAQPTAAQACQSGKNTTAGEYAACRGNAEAKLATSGDTTKYGEAITRCAARFTAAWQKLENEAVAAGTSCPSVGDATGINSRVTATTDTVAAIVGGVRFKDNGDGTVTDHQTGLQWEKKNNLGGGEDPDNLHDADNLYSWSTFTFGIEGGEPDGTAFTDFLLKLNACKSVRGGPITGGFAGHCDWRLPTIEELKTIVDVTQGNCGGGSGPCIDPVFGPTVAHDYWSFTTHDNVDDPHYAWQVNFGNHSEGRGYKFGAPAHVRAVRTVRTGS